MPTGTNADLRHPECRHPMTISRAIFPLILLWSMAMPLAAIADQNGDAFQGIDAPTLNLLESAKSTVASDQTLDEAQKAKALERYDQALNWLLLADRVREERKQLEETVKNAPKLIGELLHETARAGDHAELKQFIAQADLPTLELRISQDELDLAQAREEQKQHLESLANLLVGSKQLNDQIDDRGKSLSQIQHEIMELPIGEPKSLTQARELSLKSRQMLRQAELELLKLKLGNQSLLTNLTQARRDNTASRISRLQADLTQLNTAAAELRESRASEARLAAEQLQAETANLPASLRLIAEENARNRSELEQLVYREKQVTYNLTTAKQQLDEIRTDFASTRQRVEVVGASEAIGGMLYRRREALPSFRSYSRNSAKRKEEINQATDRQINIEELLRERGNLQQVVAHTLESLPDETEQLSNRELGSLTENLARSRRDALNELQKVYSRFIAQLTSLDLAERQLVEVSESYINYINDQLIWISSGKLTDVDSLTTSLGWLITGDKWAQLAKELLSAIAHRPVFALLVIVLATLLISKRRTAAAKLPILAKSVRKIRTDAFRLTLWALFYSLIKIGLLPLLMIGFGLQLRMLPTAAPFTIAIADALITVSISLTASLLLYEVCRPEGVGQRHLRWAQGVCAPLNRELRWAIPATASFRFVVALSAGANLPAEVMMIGRLSVIAIMAVSLAFIFRLLGHQSELMHGWRKSTPHSLLVQLHFLWYPLLLLIGAGIIISTALGYQALALRLLEHLEITFWFFLGLFFLKELLLRYLFVAERRLRYENALRKREELRAQREKEQPAAEDESAAISVEIPEINFNALSEQAKRLVRFGYLFAAVVGSWMIWGDLLPAIDFITRIELPISTHQMVDGISTETPLALSDLLVGLAALAVTLLAAKNLPGVLEITLLQRLPLDPGARYALTTLLQYLIVGVGVISAFSTIGFQWSSIQWLVAALGVGLGFGLQEIVANFISGIILLFERPIRVGDVVTLDDTTGVVSRIRIRATTIINYDKQEMLIPNKEFITGRVINWTLTDKVNRVVVTVGVAYGSDVNRAMALMLEAAHENDNVLSEPPPVATFEAFGDNALTLLLRSYLGSMENRLPTITALHEAINRKFNQAGISIAFPQRDLHLDTARPLDIRVSRAPREPEPE
ncbi:MAG: mechanosensitive ion channel [Candidatus Thiodiazotropha sp.]